MQGFSGGLLEKGAAGLGRTGMQAPRAGGGGGKESSSSDALGFVDVTVLGLVGGADALGGLAAVRH